MLDVDVGGSPVADPIARFADQILGRYGVEQAPGIGSGPASFGEQIAADWLSPRISIGGADDLIGRFGSLSVLGPSRWFSYLDLQGASPVGAYRTFGLYDAYYLPVEREPEEELPFWRRGGAAAPDPEAWKLWTLFPKARPAPAAAAKSTTAAPAPPVPEPSPTPRAAAVPDGPWSSTAAPASPVRTRLDSSLPRALRGPLGAAEARALRPPATGRWAEGAAGASARDLPSVGPRHAPALAAGRWADDALSVSARHLPALAGGLRALERRGLSELHGATRTADRRRGTVGAARWADPAVGRLVDLGVLPEPGRRRTVGASGAGGATASSAAPRAAGSWATAQRPDRSGGAGFGPEQRPAGAGPRTGAVDSFLSDERLRRMGVAGWAVAPTAVVESAPASGPPAPAGRPSRGAGVWASLPGHGAAASSAFGPVAGPALRIPALPPAIRRLVPRGAGSLVSAGPSASPLRLPAGPLSAAEAARVIESVPEVGRWFRFVGARASGLAELPGAPGAEPAAPASAAELGLVRRRMQSLYLSWIEWVRSASRVDAQAAEPGAGAARGGRAAAAWGAASRAAEPAARTAELAAAAASSARPAWPTSQGREPGVEAALPPALRALAPSLSRLLPGASGALAARLEAYLPPFLAGIRSGAGPEAAATAAGLARATGRPLLDLLAPGAASAEAFVPPGMASTGPSPRAGGLRWLSPGAGRQVSGPAAAWAAATARVGDADQAWGPPLGLARDQAVLRSLLSTSLSGLAPSELLQLGRAASAGGAALPGALLTLLPGLGRRAGHSLAGPAVARELGRLLGSGPWWRAMGLDAPPAEGASPAASLPSEVREALVQALAGSGGAGGVGFPRGPLLRALTAAGLPADPISAMSALLAAGPLSPATARVLGGYARSGGAGELTAPERGAPTSGLWLAAGARAAQRATPPEALPSSPRPGPVPSGWPTTGPGGRAVAESVPGTRAASGGAGAGAAWDVAAAAQALGPLFPLAAGEMLPGGSSGDPLHVLTPALIRGMQRHSDWAVRVDRAGRFVPAIAGRPRALRPATAPGRGQLPVPEGAAVAGVASERAAAARGEAPLTSSPPAAAPSRAPGLLVPPALRAVLGGRALPEAALRRLLGMEGGAGTPTEIDALVDLLSPAASRGAGRRIESIAADRLAGPAGSALTRSLRRAAGRIEEVIEAVSEVRRAALRAGRDGPGGSPLRVRRASLDLVRALGRKEPAVLRRLVGLMGGTTAEESLFTPGGLRALAEGGQGLNAEGRGDLITGERQRARKLREQVSRRREVQRGRRQEARKQARAREAGRVEAEGQRETVEQDRYVADRTLKLARSLFPKSLRDLPAGGPRLPFPSALPEVGPIDLMLVAPAVELIRAEASPLLKESAEMDGVRQRAAVLAPERGAETPSKIEKFLSPEKINEFARRSYDLLLDELELDAERHGLDPLLHDFTESH